MLIICSGMIWSSSTLQYNHVFTWDFVEADGRTLIRPDHISITRGAAGAWRSGLKKEEVAILVDRYREWFADAGYQTHSANDRESA